MNFYNTIYQLITENNCVIIPNFGAFISRDCSATLNFSKQEFSPPKREVIFNSEIKHNDNLIVNYIAVQKNISFTQASEIIDKYVNEINKFLQAGEEVTFNKIGKFSIQNQQLIFVTNQNENTDENSYGLTSFVYPYLQRNTSIKKVNLYTNTKPRKKSKLKWILVPVAATFLVTALFLSRNYISIHSSNNKNNASIFPTEIISKTEKKQINSTNNDIEEKIIEESIIEETRKSENENIEENIILKNTEISNNSNENVENIAFVIAGAFSIYQNALNLQKELQNKGYNSEIFSADGKLHRVSIKGYISHEEAINDLLNLEKNSNYNGLWILYTK